MLLFSIVLPTQHWNGIPEPSLWRRRFLLSSQAQEPACTRANASYVRSCSGTYQACRVCTRTFSFLFPSLTVLLFSLGLASPLWGGRGSSQALWQNEAKAPVVLRDVIARPLRFALVERQHCGVRRVPVARPWCALLY